MFQLELNYYTNLCSKSAIVKLFYITKKIGSVAQFWSEWIPKILHTYILFFNLYSLQPLLLHEHYKHVDSKNNIRLLCQCLN
jgi:hypothetical protein